MSLLRSKLYWFTVVTQAQNGRFALVRVKGVRSYTVRSAFLAAGINVLHVAKDSEIPEASVSKLYADGRIKSLEHGDWSLLREPSSGSTLINHIAYFVSGSPDLSDEWASGRAYDKAREVANDALALVRKQWAEEERLTVVPASAFVS